MTQELNDTEKLGYTFLKERGFHPRRASRKAMSGSPDFLTHGLNCQFEIKKIASSGSVSFSNAQINRFCRLLNYQRIFVLFYDPFQTLSQIFEFINYPIETFTYDYIKRPIRKPGRYPKTTRTIGIKLTNNEKEKINQIKEEENLSNTDILRESLQLYFKKYNIKC